MIQGAHLKNNIQFFKNNSPTKKQKIQHITKLYLIICLTDISRKKEWIYHSEPDVCFLQGWTIVGTITGDSHDFSIGTYLAIDDALDQGVLVHRLGSGQDTEFRPDLI